MRILLGSKYVTRSNPWLEASVDMSKLVKGIFGFSIWGLFLTHFQKKKGVKQGDRELGGKRENKTKRRRRRLVFLQSLRDLIFKKT